MLYEGPCQYIIVNVTGYDTSLEPELDDKLQGCNHCSTPNTPTLFPARYFPAPGEGWEIDPFYNSDLAKC